MPSNRAEDRALSKLVRTALARTTLDVGEVNVGCVDGYVELTGKVRPPRGQKAGSINFKREMETIKQHIRQVRGVKDVYDTRVSFIE